MSQYYNPKEDEDWFLVAKAFGFRNWRTIYNHENNESLRKRQDPYDLHKEDKVFIPDKQPKDHQCDTNKKHTFTLPTPTRPFSLVLEDDDEDPYSDTKYEIWIEGKKYVGKNDDPEKVKRTREDGLIYEEVPVVGKLEVRVWYEKGGENDPDACEKYEIEMGHMDPIDTVEGIQHRLENLGYSCGEDSHGTLGTDTKKALKAFQSDWGLKESGEIDEDTKAALLQMHDQIKAEGP